MKDLFIPYTEALALKELGFNESCLSYFKNNQLSETLELVTNSKMQNVNNETDDYTSAPLYQQAFDWFRINHNLLSWIYSSNNVEYWYTIIGNGRFVKAHDGEETYEKAKLECLKQLIKFVKESQETKTPKKEIEVNIMITDCEDETPNSITDKLIEFIEENGWVTTGIVKAVEQSSNGELTREN